MLNSLRISLDNGSESCTNPTPRTYEWRGSDYFDRRAWHREAITETRMKQDDAQIGLPLAIGIGLFATATPIPRSIIRLALYLMKFLGLFRLARHLTGHGLRIICYHGLAVADEYKYRSTLFIKDDFFRRRMEYLRRERYPILSLRDALDALTAGRLPRCATVITMDDGWRGVYTLGLPIIRELEIPVTVYVATYYVENRMPVYTVTVSYLFWRATPQLVDLPRGIGTFDLGCEAAKAEEAAQNFGEALPAHERLEFLKELAVFLDVSLERSKGSTFSRSWMNSSCAASPLPASTSNSIHTAINGRFTTRKWWNPKLPKIADLFSGSSRIHWSIFAIRAGYMVCTRQNGWHNWG